MGHIANEFANNRDRNIITENYFNVYQATPHPTSMVKTFKTLKSTWIGIMIGKSCKEAVLVYLIN